MFAKECPPENCDLDSVGMVRWQKYLIKTKPLLFQVYQQFFKNIHSSLLEVEGPFVEVGSSGKLIQSVLSGVHTTNILDTGELSLRLDGLSLPFKPNSVGAFVMVNTFHHVKDSRAFLNGLDRCLKRRGRIVMIEPANTIWSRWVYSNFHHESFDVEAGWTVKGQGPMADANGALPWIVFRRDIQEFKNKFPSLKLVHYSNFMPWQYLFSGGFSYKPLVPSFMFQVVRVLEWILSPFNIWTGMFTLIVIEKQTDG